MYLVNFLYFSVICYIEFLLLKSVFSITHMSYIKDSPKYDTYYLLLAITSILISNTCYLLSFNYFLFPKELSFFIKGKTQITYNFFNMISLFFFGIYLLKNLTFKSSLFQKTIMTFLELTFIIYLVFIPMNINGDVWSKTLSVKSIFELIFGLGQITTLSNINAWLTLFLCLILLLYSLLFIYSTVTMTRSKEHSNVFHQYTLFLIYGYTVYLYNVIDFSCSVHYVLNLTLIVTLIYKIYFIKNINKAMIVKERLTEEEI